MRLLALFLCLLAVPASAEDDEASRLKLVQYMLKTPLAEASPALVSHFQKLDTKTLPAKYRDKAFAKQLEILAVLKIHDGKKKGPFRFPKEGCEPKRYEGAEGVRIMGMIAGNEEIAWEEEDYIERKTNCNEDRLICEFSLNIVVIPRKGQPPLKRFWLMNTDPLMSLVAEKRAGGGSTGRYFQELKPSCQEYVK